MPSAATRSSSQAPPPLYAKQWAACVDAFGASKTVLTFDDLAGIEEKISYAELDARANKLSRVLRETYNVSRGDPVVSVCDNRPDMFELMLACQKIGAINVPLATDLLPEHTQTLVNTYVPKLVIADAAAGATTNFSREGGGEFPTVRLPAYRYGVGAAEFCSLLVPGQYT